MQEDFGWKLVHGDVFRPPTCTMLLSVVIGSGAQLFCMTFITLGEQFLTSLSLLCPSRGTTSPDCRVTSLCPCRSVVFACLGFLSPSNRGALMTAVLVNLISVWSLPSLILLLLVDRYCSCSRELCRAMSGLGCTSVSGISGAGLCRCTCLTGPYAGGEGGYWGLWVVCPPFEMNITNHKTQTFTRMLYC